jgi:hypothetical protein
MTQLVGNAAAAPLPCTGIQNAPPIGQCKMIHGRVKLWGDGWLTFWPIGTKRLMTIQGNVPPHLDTLINISSDTHIVGDFEVCPLKKDRPGVSQWICIATASRLVVVPEAWADQQQGRH